MLHHITAICKDPQRTIDFYVEVLGLRLVKLTINQDDPYTYHLYFANRIGSPGTVMTFFPWQDLPQGHAGPGMVASVEFAIPRGSLEFWELLLREHGVSATIEERFDENVLIFTDPDGLQLGLIETKGVSTWTHTIAKEHAIIGFYGVTLMLDSFERTAKVLEVFGYEKTAQDAQRIRFSAGTIIDILVVPDAHPGKQGHGTVHHIAFQAESEQAQLELRSEVLEYAPTPPIDRYYFKSVYFREPGGVLFEIATNGPGFLIDEDEESLGSQLVLPGHFEQYRAQIEQNVTRIKLPQGGYVPSQVPLE